jgi:hypothetical protein
VTSKSGAGQWAADQLVGDDRATCLRVTRLRAEPDQPASVDLLKATADAMEAVLRRIAKLRAVAR